ncbi:M14 family zinc carboxypeptidase [uncultured Paraglaciecola sp.]|mgnify:FL=1|uniref:M14 family zinc carboxypeptidase n=1 Tax=uncultured Paraglaciecola sp. TaxID=1765024 RepID=UPI0030D7BECC|tara:strand:+ start:2217 stop:4793 length:2577 start_codon:yes stop_codon:yes gene_type:complete
MCKLLSSLQTLALSIVFVISFQAQSAPKIDSLYAPSSIFDSAVTPPEVFLGHDLGQHMTRNDMMIAYFRQLASQSDRVKYDVIGYSNENRPIVTLTITSPANQQKLDQIRLQHLAQQDISEPAISTAEMPVVSWINFGVHGGEVSSTDSAMPIAYHLAAAQGDAMDTLLDNSIILLTASFNPDGNTRESGWNWQYSSDVAVSDPNHVLHRSPWPAGRTNHYWFDLNRQWMLQQQPEPVAWVSKFHQWRPNIVADFHEMRSYKSFYFHPGAPDRVHPLIDKKAMTLLSEVVQGPRDFMDSEARLYFNEESYDNFYLGKGATYPLMYGSLGILFEQASSGGLLETPRGVLSFRDNIRTFYRVGLALLNNAVEKRQSLLAYQRGFAKNSSKHADKDDIKGYVFAAPEDPARLFHFLQLLERNQIKVKPLTKDLTIKDMAFKAQQAYVVETDQASYAMVKGLFEKITKFENNTFYDVSGWTMPLAFGIEFTSLTRSNYKVGEAISPVFPTFSAPPKANVAYAFDWSHYYAPKVLYRLLGAGFLPRIARAPFKAQTAQGEHTFGRGSVMVSVGWQGGIQNQADSDKLAHIMQQAATVDGVPVFALDSSHTSSVGMDLGSNYIEAVTLPKVLLVIGPGMSQYQAGEVWYLLDKRMQMPVVMVTKNDLNNMDLQSYSHIVMADGKYADISADLTLNIENWVEGGGSLVGIGDGAQWAAKAMLNVETVKIKAGEKALQKRIDYGEKDHVKAQDIIGGAIMSGDLDNTHPIGYGYARRTIATQRSGLLAFEPPTNPYATVVKIPEHALLTGYASKENQQQLAGKAMLVAQRKGKGRVILFSDDPNFRGYFYGTEKLFLNSLFFSGLF